MTRESFIACLESDKHFLYKLSQTHQTPCSVLCAVFYSSSLPLDKGPTSTFHSQKRSVPETNTLFSPQLKQVLFSGNFVSEKSGDPVLGTTRVGIASFAKNHLSYVLQETAKVMQPLLLGSLIRYFTPGSDVSKLDAYMLAFGICLCVVCVVVFHHPYFYGMQKIGMRLRIASCSLIYKKV